MKTIWTFNGNGAVDKLVGCFENCCGVNRIALGISPSSHDRVIKVDVS
jgi:hypothetical protein